MKTRLIAFVAVMFVAVVALAQKSHSVNMVPALSSLTQKPMSSSGNLFCTQQGDTNYCCPPSTPWFCQFSSNGRTRRVCAPGSTNEELAELRNNCDLLLSCSGSCPF